MTNRRVYYVTGYIAMVLFFILFQLRAEAAYEGRISAGFLTGAFLLVYGALSVFVMVLFYNRFNRFEQQTFSALLALSLGLWTVLLCAAHTPYFSVRSAGALSACAKHLCVPLAYAYLSLKPGRLKRRVFRLSAAACSVLSVVLTPFTGVFPAVLYLLLAASVFAFTVRDVVKDLSADRVFSTEALLQYGFASLVLLVLFNALISLLQAANVTDGTFLLRVICPFFASVYLMAVTFAFSVFVSESYAKYDENAVLFHAAYEDPLTGLSNRAAWDEKMKEADAQPSPYCIISLDLDGLKGVNDTWGHEAGDRLIKGFARCLADAFTEPHFLARIGGDEFCVIMEGVTEDEVKRRLRSLDTRLGVLNRRDKEVNHSCSYGYAFRDENKGGAHEIYLEADAKMYAEKQMHKAQRKADAITKEDSAEVKVARMVNDTLRSMSPQAAKEAASAAAARYTGTQGEAKERASRAETATKTPVQNRMAANTSGIASAGTKIPGSTPAGVPQPKRAQTQRMMDAKDLRRTRLSQEEESLRTLQKIQDTEIQQVAKEVRVKKALKALKNAQEK